MERSAERVYEEWLVLRCQGGDGDALRTLVQRWHPRLLRLAWRLSQSDEAEEIVQEAWLGIVRGLTKLRDPALFGLWARRITANKCRDWIRRRTRERRVDERVASEGPSDHPRASDPAAKRVERLRDGLEELQEEQRAILEMYYLEGMSMHEVAQALSIPDGTAKSRLFHARHRLRECLEEEHEAARNR